MPPPMPAEAHVYSGALGAGAMGGVLSGPAGWAHLPTDYITTAGGYPSSTPLPSWNNSIAGWPSVPVVQPQGVHGVVPVQHPGLQGQPMVGQHQVLGTGATPAEVRAELRLACMAEDFNRIQVAVYDAERLGMMDEAARGGRRLVQMRMFVAAKTMNQEEQAQASFQAMAAAREGWEQARGQVHVSGGAGVSGTGMLPWGVAQPTKPSHHPKGSGQRDSLDDDVLGLVQQVEEQRRAEEQTGFESSTPIQAEGLPTPTSSVGEDQNDEDDSHTRFDPSAWVGHTQEACNSAHGTLTPSVGSAEVRDSDSAKDSGSADSLSSWVAVDDELAQPVTNSAVTAGWGIEDDDGINGFDQSNWGS